MEMELSGKVKFGWKWNVFEKCCLENSWDRSNRLRFYPFFTLDEIGSAAESDIFMFNHKNILFDQEAI